MHLQVYDYTDPLFIISDSLAVTELQFVFSAVEYFLVATKLNLDYTITFVCLQTLIWGEGTF
jgi:hypothetical protein